MNGRTSPDQDGHRAEDRWRKPPAYALLGAALLWLSQPPLAWWPLALVALVPWLVWITDPRPRSRRQWVQLWIIATGYWLLTLQGLRYAHPVMYLSWMVLSAYLAVYSVGFIAISRRLLTAGLPIWIVAPSVWVGMESIRNYLLTGISVTMLGHSMADVPLMIQIADLFGTYGVSFVLVAVNVGCYAVIEWMIQRDRFLAHVSAVVFALSLVTATCIYGIQCLGRPPGESLARFALIQRSEPVEFAQSIEREVEIFQNYLRQSVTALSRVDEPVDVVVWPESMFSGGAPWMIAAPGAKVPDEVNLSSAEFQDRLQQHGEVYLDRVAYVQSLLAAAHGSDQPPDLIVGCGVVHYDQRRHVYSGVTHLANAQFIDWYGKTHLVMIGEYVPIVPRIPVLRELVPAELGLDIGPGANRFQVDDTTISPNICIETAVERVIVGQVAELVRLDGGVDVVVTVTNDGWFDDSSVIDHHLRCAQLVAVGCRRPLLSAANNGPTAWIDPCGRLVERLPQGGAGSIIATPRRDNRVSLYVRIGDWPARILGLLCAGALLEMIWRSIASRRQRD